jgi:regulator of protease activity HflC (stomatin/prohibitin superfamily)
MNLFDLFTGPMMLVLLAIVFLTQAIRVLNEYERGVIFRLGRAIGAKGPGLIILIPGIDKMVKVSLRVVDIDVPPQDIITKDNVSVKVNAVVFLRVIDSMKAVVEVKDYLFVTTQLAQGILRSILGQFDLDDLLSNQEQINQTLQKVIDERTDPWGIKVSMVEIKHVDLPAEMQRAMAKQAEAERERRAKIIAAEGEFQASQKLSEAAAIISEHPAALQLRYLQTLVEIAAENNSTTIFPIPMELFEAFKDISLNLKSKTGKE